MQKLFDRNRKILLSNIDSIYGSLLAEGNNSLDNVRISGSNKIGFFSYIGRYSEISNVNIGRYCSIAPRVIIGAPEHDINSFTTHLISINDKGPFNFIDDYECWVVGNPIMKNKERVTIGNDVWIGDGAIIRKGVTIGDGAIIGARAVISKNVEPYSIVVSDDNKILKFRFDYNTILSLLESKWWEYDISSISSKLKSIDDNNKKVEFLIESISGLEPLESTFKKIIRDPDNFSPAFG